MSRLTRSEIETLIDDLIVAHPIYTPQLRALREQSLSQEAVRDEADVGLFAAGRMLGFTMGLEAAAKCIEPSTGLSADGTLLIRKGQDAIRALKREPNAAARSEQEAAIRRANASLNGPEPAPAVPDVVNMVKLAEDYISLKRTLISGDEIVKLARAFILLAKPGASDD